VGAGGEEETNLINLKRQAQLAVTWEEEEEEESNSMNLKR
jgi:hypothetical protein